LLWEVRVFDEGVCRDVSWRVFRSVRVGSCEWRLVTGCRMGLVVLCLFLRGGR
jgi:hypothetical protein